MSKEINNKISYQEKYEYPIVLELLKSKLKNKKFKFVVATKQEDLTLGLDCKLIFKNRTLTVALRGRTFGYRKWKDMTIRIYNKGYKTEIDKINEGIMSDIYIYYVLNPTKDKIVKCIIVNMKKLRKTCLNKLQKQNHNNDGTGLGYIEYKDLFENNCVMYSFNIDKKTYEYNGK
jgi:hypothetical protein